MKYIDNIDIENKHTDSSEVIIPKILHYIWVGDSAPDFVELNLLKWKELMPAWEFKFWTNDTLNENFFDNDFLAFISKMNTGVEKSDAIRYYVVEKYGGVYVDADVTPNRSLNPILSLDKEVIICHDLEVTWEYISIGFFASVPNHPLFKELNKRIFSAKINTGESHMHTGPRLFGQCIFDVKPEQNYGIIPTKYFYKNVVDSTDIEELNGSETFSGRFGNHLYKKNWQKLSNSTLNNQYDYELNHHINIENFAQDRAAHSFMKRELEIVPDQKGKRILDVGGGPQSMLLDCFDFEYGEVVDPINYPQHIKKLSSLYPACNITFTHSSIEDYENKEVFDEVWCYNVLPHAKDKYLFFNSILRCVRDGGILRIMEPWNPGYEGHPLKVDGNTFNYIKAFGKIIKDTEFNAQNEKLFMNNHYVLILKVRANQK